MMQIKIIYPEPLLRQQIEFMEKINEDKKDWNAYFKGNGGGEVEMIITKMEEKHNGK